MPDSVGPARLVNLAGRSKKRIAKFWLLTGPFVMFVALWGPMKWIMLCLSLKVALMIFLISSPSILHPAIQRNRNWNPRKVRNVASDSGIRAGIAARKKLGKSVSTGKPGQRRSFPKKPKTMVEERDAAIREAYRAAIADGYSEEEAMAEADATWHNHPLTRSQGDAVYNSEFDTSGIVHRGESSASGPGGTQSEARNERESPASRAARKAGFPGERESAASRAANADALAEDYLMAENYAEAEKARDELQKLADSGDATADSRLVDVEYDRTEPVIDSLKGKSADEMRERLENTTGLEQEEVQRALNEIAGDLGSEDADNAENALVTAKSGVNTKWQENAKRDIAASGRPVPTRPGKISEVEKARQDRAIGKGPPPISPAEAKRRRDAINASAKNKSGPLGELASRGMTSRDAVRELEKRDEAAEEVKYVQKRRAEIDATKGKGDPARRAEIKRIFGTETPSKQQLRAWLPRGGGEMLEDLKKVKKFDQGENPRQRPGRDYDSLASRAKAGAQREAEGKTRYPKPDKFSQGKNGAAAKKGRELGVFDPTLSGAQQELKNSQAGHKAGRQGKKGYAHLRNHSANRKGRIGIQGQKGVTNLKKGTAVTQKAKVKSAKDGRKKTTGNVPSGPKFASGMFWSKQPRDPRTGRWI